MRYKHGVNQEGYFEENDRGQIVISQLADVAEFEEEPALSNDGSPSSKPYGTSSRGSVRSTRSVTEIIL